MRLATWLSRQGPHLPDMYECVYVKKMIPQQFYNFNAKWSTGDNFTSATRDVIIVRCIPD